MNVPEKRVWGLSWIARPLWFRAHPDSPIGLVVVSFMSVSATWGFRLVEPHLTEKETP